MRRSVPIVGLAALPLLAPARADVESERFDARQSCLSRSTFAPAEAGVDIEGYAEKGEIYTYEKHGFAATAYQLATDQLGTQSDPPAHWAPEYPAIDELPEGIALGRREGHARPLSSRARESLPTGFDARTTAGRLPSMTSLATDSPSLTSARPARDHAGARLRALAERPSLRDLLLVAMLLLCASAIARADEQRQDWVPKVLRIPDDAELLSDRQIGSTVRMLSIATAEAPDALFAEWEDALRSNGYSIEQGKDELVANSIEFSGSGILNAKIVGVPDPADDGRTVIEFDATLP